MEKDGERLVIKSSRHTDIAGKFGEQMILFYLSSKGFECVKFDYVGIDIFARSEEGDNWGISVKFKSLDDGKPSIGITQKALESAEKACEKLEFKPFIATVFERGTDLIVFFCPVEIFKNIAKKSQMKYRLDLREESWKRYKSNPHLQFFCYTKNNLKSKWFE
ncbi:hypothetical protein ACWNPK_20995 [Bacillus atrophaeus]